MFISNDPVIGGSAFPHPLPRSSDHDNLAYRRVSKCSLPNFCRVDFNTQLCGSVV